MCSEIVCAAPHTSPSTSAQVGVGPESCSGFTCATSVLPSNTEQRTHFGLWAVLSSPLTISMDLTNATVADAVWPIITNVDAITVNQVRMLPRWQPWFALLPPPFFCRPGQAVRAASLSNQATT